MAMGGLLPAVVLALLSHPLPDDTYQRGIQVIVSPHAIDLHYELTLSPKTIAEQLQKLRPNLKLPEALEAQQELYLSALKNKLGKEILVSINDQQRPLHLESTSIDRSHHEKFVWDYRIEPLPKASEWTLTLEDRTFPQAKIASRLALKGRGLKIVTCNVPQDLVRVSQGQERENETGRTDKLLAIFVRQKKSPPAIPVEQPTGDNQPGWSYWPSNQSLVWIAVSVVAVALLMVGRRQSPKTGRTE